MARWLHKVMSGTHTRHLTLCMPVHCQMAMPVLRYYLCSLPSCVTDVVATTQRTHTACASNVVSWCLPNDDTCMRVCGADEPGVGRHVRPHLPADAAPTAGCPAGGGRVPPTQVCGTSQDNSALAYVSWCTATYTIVQGCGRLALLPPHTHVTTVARAAHLGMYTAHPPSPASLLLLLLLAE
jgi:hypothetical protein